MSEATTDPDATHVRDRGFFDDNPPVDGPETQLVKAERRARRAMPDPSDARSIAKLWADIPEDPERQLEIRGQQTTNYQQQVISLLISIDAQLRDQADAIIDQHRSDLKWMFALLGIGVLLFVAFVYWLAVLR